MDKKNLTIGITLLAAAFATLWLGNKFSPAPPAPVKSAAVAASGTPGQPSATLAADAPTSASASAASTSTAAFSAAIADSARATVTELENDFVKVRFTDFGGAIREVALKKYAAVLGRPEPFLFNELHADPMLAFTEFPGLDRNTGYQLVSHTPTEVVYRTVLDGRLEVTRRYVLAPNSGKETDPYQLRHETTFRNLTDKVAAPARVALALGTAAPASVSDLGAQLTTGISSENLKRMFGGFLVLVGCKLLLWK